MLLFCRVVGVFFFYWALFLVSRNCRLVWSCLWPLGSVVWLLGGRYCGAASLVILADVRSVCDSVTSSFICCGSFELLLSMHCTLFVPFALVWPGCASGAGLCRWPFIIGSAGSLMFHLKL